MAYCDAQLLYIAFSQLCDKLCVYLAMSWRFGCPKSLFRNRFLVHSINIPTLLHLIAPCVWEGRVWVLFFRCSVKLYSMHGEDEQCSQQSYPIREDPRSTQGETCVHIWCGFPLLYVWTLEGSVFLNHSVLCVFVCFPCANVSVFIWLSVIVCVWNEAVMGGSEQASGQGLELECR